MTRQATEVRRAGAARHLPDHFHFGRAYSRPIPAPQPVARTLGRIEGVLHPLAPLGMVTRAADVPAGRRGVVDLGPGILQVRQEVSLAWS